MNKNFINLIIYFVIIIICIIIFAIYFNRKESFIPFDTNTKPNNTDTNNKPNNNSNTTKMYNFNTSWCGYSVRFQPIWDEFKKSNANPSLEIIDVKCDNDDNKDLCKKYDVPGYPSVVKVHSDGSIKHFDGTRTVEGLMDFSKN